MALLCFLLDLRNIPPPLLQRLKQLKIGYRPGEKFSLRDFHHAVNNIPLDGFLPEQHGGALHTGDVSLTNLFSNRAIYSWAADDISKKVIAICMSARNTESLRRSLMDAAEQCITVEFVMLETEAAFMYDNVSENDNAFIHRICDLENCVVRRYNPEIQVLHGLVKRWLEELKDDKEDSLQAVFVFRDPIINSVKQIYCNLYASANQIIDDFPSCQTCKCHGHPIDLVATNNAKWMCPITSRQLVASDVTVTAVRIGEQTVLYLPTSEGCSNLRRVSTTISFDVIKRTELASLNEGVIMGTPHVVIPSSNDVEVSLTDESSDQNTQIFYGLCQTLFKLDQGLVCSSSCNTETMKIGSLQCYYLVQPSEKGPMLLRRLAGSEEILPLPGVSRDCNSTVTKEIKDSIEMSLSKIELKDYNPLQHERGFHSKLNCLVKDSLQFGSIASPCGLKDPHHLDSFSEPQPQVSTYQGLEESKFLNQPEKAGRVNGHILSFSEPQASSFQVPKENKLSSQSNKGKASPSISEEWEKLIIIDDLNDDLATPAAPRPAAAKPQRAKPPTPVKPLDEKTSRILERLEAPRAKKQRANASNKASTSAAPAPAPSRVANTQTKKPPLPFEPSASQPLRPTFNKIRRKLPT
ncbi:uncharacterized protein LOC133894915 isoform X2 [Phragmites australis]|uniref:uncharacterized protein LOC133894915 isoform X2 n=1 Tax=Phragmites australis TaxID=29695 RepID=UPI002D78A373|nr:uncharacterized protein LOC133894915 isoform X2 [Phragmites australis]